MPLTSTANLSTLYTQVRSIIRARFQNRGVNDGQFLGKLTRALSMGLLGVQQTIEAVDRDSPPSSLSSDAGIAAWAFTYGVPSNAGGFGANIATTAGGGAGTVTGTGGTHVLAGTQLLAPDGTTTFSLVDPGPGYGVIPFTGTFVAVTPGTVGNLPIGSSLTWISPPAGCDSNVLLSVATSGGTDAESSDSLLTRTLIRLQDPPKGGANVDYDGWALSVAGVFQVFVYPRRAGTGTVDVVITQNGSGTGRQITSSTVINAVKAAIALVNPTNVETVNVITPYMPTAQQLWIKVQTIPSVKYSWDWNDTTANGGPWTKSAYNAGTPSITLNQAAPADLIAAINAGLKPRIQVDTTTTGYHTIPEMRRVTAISGGNTVLTLDSPLVIVPTNGDRVYAGAYFVPTVATNVLNYIDTIGPSRQSGLADNVNPWNDFVSTMSIAGVAEDSLDTDLLTKMVARVLLGGVTIAINGGSYSVQDYQPIDDGANAPQLAFATKVLIVQPQ